MPGRGSIVTGASGFLGGNLMRVLAARGPVHGTHLTRSTSGSTRVDLRDARDVDAFFAGLGDVDLCVHCAARAGVGDCERDPAGAWSDNVEATRHVAQACARRGVKLVYVSTDFVFDGTKTVGGYSEEDLPSPLQTYGRTKVAGEEAALEVDRAVVVRSPFLYTFDAEPGAKSWPRQVLERLARGETVHADGTEIRQPTHVDDICRVIVELVSSDVSGIVHVAAQEGFTKLEWARSIARLGGHDEGLVAPETRPDPPIPRPVRSWLSVERLAGLGIRPPRPASELTSEFLKGDG